MIDLQASQPCNTKTTYVEQETHIPQAQYEGEIDLVAVQLLAYNRLLAFVRDAEESLFIQELEASADPELRNRLVSIIQRLGLILGRFR